MFLKISRLDKSSLRFCLLTLAILLSGQLLAAGALDRISATKTIHVGIRTASIPFSYTDAQMRPMGYSIDICMKIIEAIKRETRQPHLNIEYIPVTSSNRIPIMLAGEIDIECGSTTNNSERRKQVNFSITTFVAQVRLLTHKSSGIKSVMDLGNKKVIVTKGTTSEAMLQKMNDRLLMDTQLVYSSTFEEAFELLEKGNVDAFILDDVLLYGQRATSKNPENLVVTAAPLSIEALAIMLPKDDHEFKKLVDTEIVRIITQGEINDIYKKWFLSPIPPNHANLNYLMSSLVKQAFKMPSDWAP